jgi:hypothetical protein
MNRSRTDAYVPSTISYRSRFSRHNFSLSTDFVKPMGKFTRNLKDRTKFVWELIKLNYRMLISLTLTLFVAIFVHFP